MSGLTRAAGGRRPDAAGVILRGPVDVVLRGGAGARSSQSVDAPSRPQSVEPQPTTSRRVASGVCSVSVDGLPAGVAAEVHPGHASCCRDTHSPRRECGSWPSWTRRKLFGTDGIRGVANVDPMTPEMALRLGRAVALPLPPRRTRRGRIVIGKDTRLSGYLFETALAVGHLLDGRRRDAVRPAADAGHRLHHLVDARRRRRGHLAPATTRTRTTASRSSPPTASSCPTRSRRELEELMASARARRARAPASRDIGKATKIEDSRGRYVVFLKSAFPRDAHARRAAHRRRLRATAPPTRSRPRCSPSSAPR